MGVDKFSISLPSELAAEVDALAEAEGVSRSAVIREAAAEYVASRRSAEREAARRERVDAALAGFDAIAERWGADERSVTDLLAEVRGEDAGSERG